MARALFKSWFVDFDPVRAKQVGWVSPSGRNPPIAVNGGLRGDAANPPYDLPPHMLDLFPDSFEDSELGEIPKGWQIRSIGDLADVVGGTTPSTNEPAYWEGGTHAWATPKDLSGLSVPILLDTERRITDAGLSQVGSGLLPKGTVLLSSRAPIGYLAVAEIPVAINQGFIAMKPKTGTSNLYLLLWASVAHEEIVSRANGSTFLEISKANFRPIRVVTSSSGVMQMFDQLARQLYDRIVANECESRTLATLRDTLLPKLISGELRVRAAERLIEDANA
ncbi:MAG: restriction endonuclease subunit S [Thiobacillaceae bacterium]